MAADGPTNKFQGLPSLLNIRFFNVFFSKDLANPTDLEIQLIQI